MLFILTYFCLFLVCINYKESKNTIAVSFEQTNQYVQNTYILTFNNFNSQYITKFFDNNEITILSIKPINYKSIKKEFKAKGSNVEQIYQNFINEYTTILNNKGLSEEAIYVYQKGIGIDQIKALAIEKEIMSIRSQIDFEYSVEN